MIKRSKVAIDLYTDVSLTKDEGTIGAESLL